MTFTQKIAETTQQLEQGNIDIGFRMLTDLVLDTEDISLFKEFVSFTESKYQNTDATTLHRSAIPLLEKIEQKKLIPVDIHQPIIDVTNVVKHYGTNRFQLGPVTMQILPGHLIGLVGENGNGKTTLLRLLAKDLSYTSGNITFHFQKQEDDYSLRSKLIYIPQRTPTWHGKVKDNLMLTATHYGIPADENEWCVYMYIIRFGLWPFRNYSWNELSSGYKMRFELARTFLRRPKLLLLDEPLANLDIVSQQLILEDIRMLGKSLRNPLGIVLSSQQLYEVERVSDEVVFLKHGQPSSFNTLKNETESEKKLVIELDISANKEELLLAFNTLNVLQCKQIGGSYYLEFSHASSVDVLRCLTLQELAPTYFRNISNSTRRFFH